jgi:hypothetical protein
MLTFPECTENVSPGVTALLVGLTTANCYWEGNCRECTQNTAPIVAAAPDEFVTLSVAAASRGIAYTSGNITDTAGSREFWCDGQLGSVSLGPDSWLVGTPNCVVEYLTVTGTGARVEGATINAYGPLVGINLHLQDLRGAVAVVSPKKGAYSVRCEGLTVVDAQVAVGGCRDAWSASGKNAVAIYQASSAPSGDPGTTISIDAITAVFGRSYEARFFEGVTDIDSKQAIFETSIVFLGSSILVLFGAWWITMPAQTA